MSKVIRIGLPIHLLELSKQEIELALQSNKHKPTTRYTTKAIRVSDETYDIISKYNITEHTASLLNGFYDKDEAKYHLEQLERLGYIIEVKGVTQ